MDRIVAPISVGNSGPQTANLQDALRLLLDRGVIRSLEPPNSPTAEELAKLGKGLAKERTQSVYGNATQRLVLYIQLQEGLGDGLGGEVEAKTAALLNRFLKKLGVLDEPPMNEFTVKGVVTQANGEPAVGMEVRAFDRDLRTRGQVGQMKVTGEDGRYEIGYSQAEFIRAEKGSADLIIRAEQHREGFTAFVESPTLFNAPPSATVDLTIPAEVLQPPPLFENIGLVLEPLLEGLKVEELEEDKEHQDLSFLFGDTGFEKPILARFVLAHGLAQQGIRAEFWFVLLGGSFYQFAENQSLKEQLAAVLDALPSIDAAAVRKALTRGFNQNEISDAFREHVAGWVDAFLKLIARRSVNGSGKPTFVKLALEDASIMGAEKQEAFARLLNEHKALTPEFLSALEDDPSFTEEEIGDLRTSFRLAELTRADFSVVKMLKDEFDVHESKNIRTLAKKSENEWVNLVKEKHAAGVIKLPIETGEIAGTIESPAAEVYGRTLERQFREAFPTTAFSGGLERAMGNGGAKGLKRPADVHRLMDQYPEFELLNTPVDDFLNKNIDPDFQELAKDENFRQEVKAVQRVFKLAPTFEATDAMLADGVHSAQMAYRMGESEFVRSYGKRQGFTPETARATWNRATDTYAAVLTIIPYFKAFEVEGLPQVLKNGNEALSTFPNWNNLFKTGDLCECEHCRSVLGPAAYFADLLMFLKDRKGKNPANTVKDILFTRRADLGFLELNCANALTPLPYIDVVCEVLEDAVDATGENDLELTPTLPAPGVGLETAVKNIFKNAFTDPLNDGKEKIELGDNFSLSQVNSDQSVVHSDNVTYLLKKKGPPPSNFFAEVLRNTKASAAELRAYPQHVNPKAYDKLKTARYPFALPFDLFNEEVRAAFQKVAVKRWDLMRTFKGTAAPNKPTEGHIAAEYFGISVAVEDTAPPKEKDEKRIILTADSALQHQYWGELDEPTMIANVSKVDVFLRKTGLEYPQLLILLDLKFIKSKGNIDIAHLDSSCDTEQKRIATLDAEKLDCIHRFLRLWRKLPGWKMWELDLVIGHPMIGGGSIDEPFLINLFYFSEVRNKLGGNAKIEQVCALFGNLNTETSFTELHEKRREALYQSLFLNKRLIHPLDTSFAVALVNVLTPTVEKIATHQPAVLAALGIREADLDLLKGLTKASNGTPYITDDLTLTNLSFLWRHAWLAKLLKFTAADWKTLLKIVPETVPVFANLAEAQDFLEAKYHIKAAGFTQVEVDAILLKISHRDVYDFACPKTALEFLEEIERLKATGFTLDELNWLLAADRSAKAATKETDAAKFLFELRKALQAIRSEYDASKYDFLVATPPTDEEQLAGLLTTLLQKLNRDETAVSFFLATLRGDVAVETKVAGLGALVFPVGISIKYGATSEILRFIGVMTSAQQTTLNGLSADPAYLAAIQDLFDQPRLAVKFYEPVFTAPLEILPPTVDFTAQLHADLAAKITYDAEQRLLRFTGILNTEDQAELNALVPTVTPTDVAYHNAVSSLASQLKSIAPPDERIWLTDTDLDQPSSAATNTLAKRLANAAKKALDYLSMTLAANAVVQQSSAQLALTEALTRSLLEDFPVMPPIPPDTQNAALLAHITRVFAATSGAVDYASPTMKPTFDGWFWVNRAAAMLKKWKLTLAELEKIIALTAGAQLLDLRTLPLDAAGTIASIDRFIRTSHLLRLRDTLPETGITFLEVLEKLRTGAYAATTEVKVKGLPVGFTTFPVDITAGPNPIPIQYNGGVFLFKGQMSTSQVSTLLTDRSLRAVIGVASYRQAIEELFRSNLNNFAGDVGRLNDAWLAADVEALTASLDLVYPDDYLLAESWERLRRAFYFLDNLNAGADTAKTFAAAAMSDTHAKTIKELLRSKFGTETWLTLSAEIQDVLRERKRDALAAYLLTHPLPDPKPADAPSGKWENTNDLYAYYLLDVEMSSCQLTSRLVQGSGSVQLFVQRCFMGLEPDVVVQADGASGDSAWRWWKWMRKYRVWEANRKVFLWPENWIEPELKKDRSSFFKDMENELLQNEINQNTVETAFANYLEKLDGVAQLEIAGFYQEDDGDNAIVHVFGRTAGTEPHLYYYRRYDYRQWSPWERVELDIQGDYLIPAVVNSRVYLFWPIFTEVPDEAGNKEVTVPTVGPEKFIPDRANKRLRLRMAVSEYRQGKWTPKKVSKDYHESEPYNVEIVRKNYQFFVIDTLDPDKPFSIWYDGYSQPNQAEVVTIKTLDLEKEKKIKVDWGKALAARDAASGTLALALSEMYRPYGPWYILDYNTRYLNYYKWEYAQTPSWDFIRRNNINGLITHFEKAVNDSQALVNIAQGKVDGAKDKLDMAQLALDATPSEYTPQPIDLKPAELSGAFEISGCKGAPEQIPHVGTFQHTIRPEQTSGVPDPVFLKWVDARPPLSNDLTLKKDILKDISTDLLNALSGYQKNSTQVLKPMPPQAFKVTPAWHLSYMDKLGFDSSSSDHAIGTWLPFFYNDKKRTFMVLPAFKGFDPVYQYIPQYYPEIKKEVGSLDNTIRLYNMSSGEFASLVRLTFQRFHFKNFYHPFVCDFAKLVYNPLQGIPALMSRETQLKVAPFSFAEIYQPTDAVIKLPPEYLSVKDCHPREVVDFTPDGAYSSYNWELFFHGPLLIANSLSRNQRFEEAREWYHFIFNPIGADRPVPVIPGDSPMSKYWITKPFFETTEPQYAQQRVDNILRMLAGDTTVPGYSTQAKKDLESQVLDWRTNPFEPHRIANYRTVAYQKTVVMKYLDNLIAWGDNLFRQDSMERINEATQLYILAAEILGPRPKRIPPHAKPPVESFNELEKEFDKFSNALVQVENFVPVVTSFKAAVITDRPPLPTMLYFCIPQNDKMLGYWDTVADRLYKIRHCMNIEGVVRQLALFEPPIDPAALVKAIAGGVDISSALADLNAPLPLYRFNVLLQKANEVCNDVKALGGALLTALEKKDAEALGLLRQSQEIRLLEAVKTVREKQIEEAKENLEGLKKSKVVIETRRDYYQDIEKIIAGEQLSLNKLETAHTHQNKAQEINIAASVLGYLPNVTIGASGFGGSPHVTVQWGTGNIISALQAASGSETQLSNIASYAANRASTLAGYDRRFSDWKLQETLAERELSQIDKQIACAELRIAIAEKELENHVLQIENAKATDAFMRSKYTNHELYQWQVGQISGVYFQSYKLAYDLAKRAERCFRFELGLQDSNYIQFGYWDSLKKGLLSGEKLQYDLRRLETAYLEQNRREFELTKHVSLDLLDPLALVKLRETGRCFVNLPEEIFDLDFPGHYFRRIKSVSVTLPCVTGPYATISCTLRLLKNSVRINTANGDNDYPRNTDDGGLPVDDSRFIEHNIPVKAVAVSTAQNDSGVFELSFRDERYLPFEGAGVISQWSLELFNDQDSSDFGRLLRQFDYSTISDAILHVKYTAREDAGPFKAKAIANLRNYFSKVGAAPSVRLLNLRQEFPSQWHRFQHPSDPAVGKVLELEMAAKLFPFRDSGKALKINTLVLLARCSKPDPYSIEMTPSLPSTTLTLVQLAKYGGLHAVETGSALNPLGLTLTFGDKWVFNMTGPNGALQPNEVEDMFLVLGYEWD